MSEPLRSPLGFTLPSGLARSRDDRVLCGVCGGVARYLGVDPVVVRLAAVILALGDAFGVLLYLVTWAVIPLEPLRPAEGVGDVDGDVATGSLAAAAGEARGGLGTADRSLRSALAVGCITLGVLVVIRSASPLFPDQVVWPAVLVAVGLAVVWARADSDQTGWRGLADRLPGDPAALLSGRGLWLRVVAGGALLIAGLAWFLNSTEAVGSVGSVGLAVLATLAGIGLLLGPWVASLFGQLREERRERIRTEERAEMAAHLHDSVLQTLALIQRRADAPQQSRSLARRQERELRAWLFDDRVLSETASLATALDQLSDDVEADHDVTVDAVVVGDRTLDPHVDALVAALREAVVNAAKHSGETEVSVYAEVEEGGIEAFVRDRGKGFDPSLVPHDRRGIADSIIGRMARHGGTAHVNSSPGQGTEVVLRLPGGLEEAT